MLPQSYELAISRIKRGGVEDIVVSWIFQASLVWSVPLLPECWCWLPHTPSPCTSIFSPLIQQGGSRKQPKEHAELLVYPTQRSLVCLTMGWQQTIHTLWCFLSLTVFQSLLLQGSSATPCLLSLHNCTEGGPLCGSDEKKSVSVEDLWESCLPVFHEVGRDAFSNLMLNFIQFLPLVLHFPLPL